MDKFLLICLAGAALVALSGAEVSSEEQSVAELAQLREVRAADSGKGKGKGKGLKKKGKKNKTGRNLNKSEKKGDRKKKGDQKKKGRENGAKRSKKNGKSKKRKNGAKKSGKKEKGLKKKSRKNKANGAGKNKDKKNKKKARKAAKKADKKEKKKARKEKKKEQKKAKKDRKNNNNKRINIVRQSSCANETCIDNAVTYMKQLKLAVKNFGKQYNRIKTNEKQTGGKAGKNDEFEPYLIKLRESGGGNASNMTCNGQKNQGAVNLQTLYDNLETCKTVINNTCNAHMPDINMTFMDACKADMDAFVNETDTAIQSSGAAACVIWESEKLANMSAMLKDCSLKDTEAEHTAAKKACTGNFSFCRKEEDKVSKLVSACSASNSVPKVTAAIAQGVKNQLAATAVSAKVNATLAAQSLAPRSTDVTCAAFATSVTEISVHVKTAPLLANLETKLKKLASSTVATCTDADKSSLGNASTTFLSSTETITLAIAEKQDALNISTGTTLNVAAASITINLSSVGTTGTTVTTTGTTGTTSTTGTTGTTTTGTTGTTTTGTTGTTTTGTTGT